MKSDGTFTCDLCGTRHDTTHMLVIGVRYEKWICDDCQNKIKEFIYYNIVK